MNSWTKVVIGIFIVCYGIPFLYKLLFDNVKRKEKPLTQAEREEVNKKLRESSEKRELEMKERRIVEDKHKKWKEENNDDLPF